MPLTNVADRYICKLVTDTLLANLDTETPSRTIKASDWEYAVATCLQQVVTNPLPNLDTLNEEQFLQEVTPIIWPEGWQTTVNPWKWYASACYAACVLYKAMNSGRLWTHPQFSGELCEQYHCYITSVERLAWQILPSEFKNGSGRPTSR